MINNLSFTSNYVQWNFTGREKRIDKNDVIMASDNKLNEFVLLILEKTS
ncbi:hypothetical protein P5G51_013675 [Virgibacillus sp. 179-BFC.A HS]|uniref:Uncharacterized protein n=1 Tax=Tigheibacillus jepli TaxID=3035914 RepID=A0ABU5CLF5_9BACI|nr:hypothetical protein [Virgibacillus sp. 179-BFC.A HS]MDY0406300.1 hypothetical protein [Virgibacillus sp. 179-BFC.A HS]